MVYKWYILPIGGLYATYHLLGEPETTIDIINHHVSLNDPPIRRFFVVGGHWGDPLRLSRSRRMNDWRFGGTSNPVVLLVIFASILGENDPI